MSERAIFLGSFNPPHKGHYEVVKSVINSGLMEKLGIDKIHVIPCWQNPNKKKFTTTFIQRYKMCMFMFEDLIDKTLVVIDIIEKNVQPKYTYELIDYFNSGKDTLVNANKEGFYWIITTETLNELIEGKWKNSKELLNNNFIIVHSKNESIDKYKSIDANAHFVTLNNDYTFHSSDLREKAKRGESIAEETCDRLDYFYRQENNVYK
jgi:nicotinate-nucleotide adenylyltransferase